MRIRASTPPPMYMAPSSSAPIRHLAPIPLSAGWVPPSRRTGEGKHRGIGDRAEGGGDLPRLDRVPALDEEPFSDLERSRRGGRRGGRL